VNLTEFLCPRIEKNCLPVWQDGHFASAAHAAMVQVELALKEKGLVIADEVFGYKMIERLLGKDPKQKSVRLRVPLGDDMQEKAEKYFLGVFGYYRNYVAHRDKNIDKVIAARVMVIASELLDLIDASYLSFTDIGGVEGLLTIGEFASTSQVRGVLECLQGQYLPDGDTEGLIDELFEKFGIAERQLGALLDLKLVRYFEEEYCPTLEELRVAWQSDPPPDTMGHFEITDLGQQFIDVMDRQKV